MRDFSLQGKVFLGDSINGKPGPMRWVNDAGLLQISGNVTQEERSESHSGNRLTSATINTATTVNFSLTLYHGTKRNLALGLYGDVNEVAEGSVTAEELPTVAAGDLVLLDRGQIDDLEIEDSAGTPATLSEGTHYRIDDADGGVIEILDVSSLTQPFVASYDHGASSDVTMFTTLPPVRYLMMTGVNTVDGSGDKIRVRLYRLKFNPVTTLDLINSSFGELALTGTALLDETAMQDPALGGFGRIELLEPAGD